MKDLGGFKYFFSIEITRSHDRMPFMKEVCIWSVDGNKNTSM